MHAQTAKKRIIIPAGSEWVNVNVPRREGRLADGTCVETGGYAIRVAMKYPVFEDGSPAVNLKHRDVPQFLREQNETYGLSGSEALRWSYGFEDEAIRELGSEHDMFNENFNRRGTPWRCGYFGDLTKPSRDLKQAEGIDQMLIQRLYFLRTLDGDVRIGPVTAAPEGMVPRFTKDELEEIIGVQGLKKLAGLRGYDIHESGDQVVDVRNPLGVAQLTFPCDFQYKGRTAPHSHHVYPPSQNDPEKVGVRGAGWARRLVERRCFDVSLFADADDSDSDRSFPLVRGEARIKIGRSFL